MVTPPSPPALRPHAELHKEGLRVEPGIDTRGQHLHIRFEAPAQLNNAPMFYYKDLEIGMYSYLRTGTVRNVKKIGRYCSIGPNVTIGEGEHPTTWLSTSPSQYTHAQFAFWPPEREATKKRRIARSRQNSDEVTGDVVIGNDVWIGGGATIRRGVTIGDGAIIAGQAFVTKDVAPYSIVAGLPAKHRRYRFAPEVIAALQDLKWWEFDINDLAGVPFDKIEPAIAEIRRREAEGLIRRCPPRFRTVRVYTRGWYDLSEAPQG